MDLIQEMRVELISV